ncbi:apolipoprotein N-acyltransferase [Haloactinopolyspora alba]|uniref:Apolipoprotein N-acyltransferase n=1 Tax=Haloactinopolyspora alba TaxID=648780 RepID=A0A2P8DY80_9ACTN|nr:apolipoprotein N-acyltransferase [Haloactinopolyspora alba]PSL02186.1 apolipoprotein N-acyltransferase [Haloactinopolyspora alba]
MSHLARGIGAAVLGAALITAFPPFDLWFLAAPVVAAFALLVREQTLKRSALLGFLFGLGFFVPMLHWTGMETGPIPWLILGVFEALFFIPLAVGVTAVQRVPGWPVWTAAVWVADEAVRGRIPYGGFTWGKLAFSQAESSMLSVASLAGSPGLSFVVALAGGLLAWVVVTRRMWVRVGAVAAVGALFTAPLLVQPLEGNGESTTVAVVQGNVPAPGLDYNNRARVITGNHVEATEQLAADIDAGRVERPDVVIWPENSSDISPFHDAQTYEAIDGAVQAVDTPVLVSAIVPTEDQQNVKNTSILWDPETGPGDTYVKRHPMPFGEYIPFRSIAERITDAVKSQPRDHLPGHEVGTFEVGPVTIGNVICFEVAFDGVVRDAVREGGQFLTVQTNNATFGYSEMTEQQLAQSQVRAFEHGRTVIVSALAGVSAIVAPDGEVRDRAELFTRDVMVTEVPLVDETTLATTIGAWPEWVLTAIGAGVLGFALVSSRRNSRGGEDGAEPEAPEMAEVSAR